MRACKFPALASCWQKRQNLALFAHESETTSKAKIYERREGNGDLQAQFLFAAGMSALFKICFSQGALQCLTNDSDSLTHTYTHTGTCMYIQVRGMTQSSSAFCSMLIRVLPFVQLNTFMLAQCHARDPGTPCHTMPYRAIPYNHTHLSPTGCEAYLLDSVCPSSEWSKILALMCALL